MDKENIFRLIDQAKEESIYSTQKAIETLCDVCIMLTSVLDELTQDKDEVSGMWRDYLANLEHTDSEEYLNDEDYDANPDDAFEINVDDEGKVSINGRRTDLGFEVQETTQTTETEASRKETSGEEGQEGRSLSE